VALLKKKTEKNTHWERGKEGGRVKKTVKGERARQRETEKKRKGVPNRDAGV